MVQFQMITGIRPGNVCSIRPMDILNRDEKIWLFQPELHKTGYRGIQLAIPLGPRSQKILLPFLDRVTVHGFLAE
jgi:hypothetical protein